MTADPSCSDSPSSSCALQQVQFDGSKESLELSLANVLADRRLRDYGLGVWMEYSMHAVM